MIEQRRSPRFELQLPVQILHAGSISVFRPALTRNISSSGVLFASDAEVQLGRIIEYVVTLANVRGMKVNLRCVGTVLRMQKLPDTTPASHLIAATLQRYEFVRREA